MLSIMPKFRTDPHFQLAVLHFGKVPHLWWTLLWVLRLGLERRIPMVLHSFGPSRCESVFILDRSEGLAVFARVSSSVNCHLSVSLAEWTLVMCFLCSMFRHPSVGCITCRMFFPSSFAPLAFFLRVQFPEGSVQPLVAVP